MSKATVTRLFVGGIIAVAAGLVLGLIAVLVAYQGGAFVMSGPDVVGIDSTVFAWSMVALILLAMLAVVGGFVAGFVSWIGALLNTAQLEDKVWFIVLLLLGLWNLGLIAMIAYVIFGPDGAKRPVQGTVPAPV